MRKYEIMYILKANLEEAARQEVVNGLHAIITSPVSYTHLIFSFIRSLYVCGHLRIMYLPIICR